MGLRGPFPIAFPIPDESTGIRMLAALNVYANRLRDRIKQLDSYPLPGSEDIEDGLGATDMLRSEIVAELKAVEKLGVKFLMACGDD